MKNENISGNNLDKVIKIIFAGEPKPPCTYSIICESDITPFQLLMKILVEGTKHLYGGSITPDQISEEQFNILKMYMESIGYSIKYNYSYKDNNIQFTEKTKIINIWFEQYSEKTDCHGRVLV
jgi:hypothetical protein